MVRYSNGYESPENGALRKNTRRPTQMSSKNRTAISNADLELIRGSALVPHNISKGAMIITLTMSPNHQVSQTAQNSCQNANLLKHNVITPIVALTSVLSMAPNRTNLKMFLVRSKARAPLANRITSLAPTNASSVLPVAIDRDVNTEPWVRMLTRNAPAKTPGQSRVPPSRSAAKAIPLGGQTTVALLLTSANDRPNAPHPK